MRCSSSSMRSIRAKMQTTVRPGGRGIVVWVLTTLESQPERHGNRAVLRLRKWCLDAQSGLDGLARGGTSPQYVRPVRHAPPRYTMCNVRCNSVPPDPA